MTSKTYKKEHTWDAYMNLFKVGKEGKLWKKQKVAIKAKSRSDAFDELRKKMIKYNRTHANTLANGGGVSFTPRGYRGR